MITVETQCQKCGVPMKVECDDSLPANEKFVSMATCDPCLKRMGRLTLPEKEHLLKLVRYPQPPLRHTTNDP